MYVKKTENEKRCQESYLPTGRVISAHKKRSCLLLASSRTNAYLDRAKF